MADDTSGLGRLPSELLLQILTPFPTRVLLPLASTSHRFHDIILRILHHRLIAAASLEDHKIILECYHPSARLTTPGLPCEYKGIDELEEVDDQVPPDNGDASRRIGRIGKLAALYAHFQPREPEGERRPRRRHPAGDIPGHPNTSSSQDVMDEIQTPSEVVSLDFYELFSQLVCCTNIVKKGPKSGIFLSCVTIGEGIIRVWRKWLLEHASLPAGASNMPLCEDKCILWLDSGKNVGVRLKVVEREDLSTPVLQRSDEDVPVSYTVQYEELLIRTSQLLLKVEESLDQESKQSGKAMVIGVWR